MSALWKQLAPFIALAAGASFVVQQAVNSTLRTQLDSAFWAAFISYLGGTLVMGVLVLVTREPLPALLLGNGWMWTGGVFGAVYIVLMIALLPRLGASTAIGLFVAGQLLTALAVDSFGLLGFERQELSTWRVVGAALLITGALLVRL